MIFRRRKDESPEPSDEAPLVEDATADATGPFDVSDVQLDPDDPSRVDLGGLVVAVPDGAELQLQVDEASQTVVSALLLTQESAVELRAFAAPRRQGIWADVRREIAAEATRMGGTASEQEGEHGVELVVVVPMPDESGRPTTQVSRMVGVDGPRWLLRATYMGKEALEPSPDGMLEQALRHLVVVRGSTPMAPREPIPLTFPGGAQLGDELAVDVDPG